MTFHVNPVELKDGEADPAAAVTKALEELQASVKAIESKSADRINQLEARLNRPGQHQAENNEDEVERKAFDMFVRRGVERMSAEEQKSLVVATDATAGYLAPKELAASVIKLLVEHSPIRSYANVITIAGPSILLPRRLTSTSAAWVSETADRTGSEPSFEQITLTPFELATFTDVSLQLLEDNVYDLEGFLAADFAESFGKTEGAALVKGTGTGQPKGIMSAAGIAEVKTGVAAAFPTTSPADVLIGMYHALPTAHAQNAAWLMNRNTLATIRKWKNTAGDYLVLDPITAGAPATLLGRPIVEAIDMPDIAAGTYPILFGDLKGYQIVDRIGLGVMRDPYSLATKGQVRFHARKRVGADLTHPDRFVKLKVSA
jgi:HK97 family phage major capsid protein